jgi:hypothetical protein
MNFDPVKEKCYFLAESMVWFVYLMTRLYCFDIPKNLVSTQNLQTIFMLLGTGFMIRDERVVSITICFGSYLTILSCGEAF